jgi:hypothetical protein
MTCGRVYPRASSSALDLLRGEEGRQVVICAGGVFEQGLVEVVSGAKRRRAWNDEAWHAYVCVEA